MTRLSRIVEDLGGAVLRVVTGDADRSVERLTLLDPTADATAEGMVLGIGLSGPEEVAVALARLDPARVAALAVREPAGSGAVVAAAAEGTGIAVVEVSRGVVWEQLLLLVQRLVDDDAGGPRDLFQLANEIAALVEAPVTIEDPGFRVLAFSGGQEDTDDGRVRTVLGRRVPESYQRRLADTGVFRELATRTGPVHVPSVFPGELPRTAVAVRAGDTVLGSIWAVVAQPLSGRRLQALEAAAEIVALQLLREQAVTSAGARVGGELLAALLTRDGDLADAARRLGVAGSPVCVVGVRLSLPEGAEHTAALHRVVDALGLHLRLVHPTTAVVTLDETVYGLLPAADEAAALRVLEEFVERSGSRTPLRAGVGRATADPAGIAVSRRDADDVLRLLRRGSRRTASARALRTDLMLLRLADQELDLPADAVVAVLARHDAEHGANLTGTLEAHLRAFGDVARAAATLHVHPSTFRYRLGRIRDVTGADLGDPDVRLAALIDLRLRLLRD
ncbi:CdaR family transcriptional regulator [Pseudonocardia sp. KRD291]|uniref:PucR family transcriptional regulator n=1 Tax=Pseudonocardia sp. KRD291 TaxID=2792007 RepID=UPI001C4A53BE|nr:PucR family transcriptional regulator [Pseudonocardia sp. KRD291]MBW0105844.1 helix-turn-helix domain-containing protein [Pseudonocardia sp. KRD291]